ncbi:phenylalanine--tRNA ligase subunit beta [Alkaliphilus peptidifermentans]|uniref:Phenylalanine--tRNA ligase beta subunit n=1 Tax=Alkaliphilus peptidifermentans DSM 18978 TaxID=1120976 RepID=A0A1G5IWX3_9FIRM|nr:phenylalanine--tRNA ligase subunit beta [Alkaliphilus peptidifermentans]SCY80221.1 phenylalanyl-tRNA synthetase beta subunit [Alkaliphilus peptidifermentans DSM 18978]
MLVPVKWLKEYVNIELSTKDLADKMTMSGSKVETVEAFGKGIEGVVVGKIESITPHPNADKLVICKINIGKELLQIVTGATNIKEGDYVPVAIDGAKLAGNLKIKKGKLRGEVSEGMLCSQDEMGIAKGLISEENKDGIWILDQEYPLGTDFMEVIPFKDEVIEFEITSNRPDCLSMVGMAREVAATIGQPIKYPEIQFKEINEKASDKARVVIEDTEGCLRYVTRVIKNVKIKQSPQWMQQRLIKAGVRPINNIVDITNYVMLEYGQPLHAFDFDKIGGDTIIVKKAQEGERFKTLDGVERTLNSNMTMIADAEKNLAIAGVMGGEESEVTKDTKWILLESATFDIDNTRNTSKTLGLRTEASTRFGKGVDSSLAIVAANRVCQLIEMLEIGEVLEGAIDVYPAIKEKRELNIRPKRINELLGTNIDTVEMIEILKSLEIDAIEKGEELTVTIPTYRDDLLMEADFVEEIGRIYGFDAIAPTMARGNIVVGGKTNGQILEELTKELLNALGFNEVLSYSFVSPKSIEKINVDENSIKRNFVKLINPLGDETSVMRTSLLPNLLEIISRNQNRKNEEVRAFELGRIFVPKNEVNELPYEIPHLVLGIYGEDEDFFTLKGAIEGLLKGLGIKDYDFEAEKYHSTYHPGRCANLVIGGNVVGALGELHPIVMDNYDLDKKCYCTELDFSLLLQLARVDKLYQPLPKYPAITRDFAVVLKEDIYVKEVEKIINENGGEILESFKLFDIYRGNQVPEDHKSVAYTLTYRHSQRTLTDEDVNKIHDGILQKIKEQLGGSLRD